MKQTNSGSSALIACVLPKLSSEFSRWASELPTPGCGSLPRTEDSSGRSVNEGAEPVTRVLSNPSEKYTTCLRPGIAASVRAMSE